MEKISGHLQRRVPAPDGEMQGGQLLALLQLGVPKGRLGLAGARWVVLPRERGEPNASEFSGISLELYQLKQLEGADESAHFLRSS